MEHPISNDWLNKSVFDFIMDDLIPLGFADWSCDNDKCGKGAICNFCATRKHLKEAIEKHFQVILNWRDC